MYAIGIASASVSATANKVLASYSALQVLL